MKIIDNQKEMVELASNFVPDGGGAFLTCRVLDSENALEWEERGSIDGVPASLCWIMEQEECASEDASGYPFDDDHLSMVKISERDFEGNWQSF